MKKIFYTLILITTISCFTSCKCSNSKTTQEQAKESMKADMHTAENSLDFYGTYEGIIPAASASGMKLTLVLMKDKTYNLTTIYVGKDQNEFINEGNFTIDDSIITLDLLNGQKQYYKIEEGRLIFLDQDKNRITGDLANHYILNQIAVD